MPDWLSELLRYGPLGLFAGAVCWGVWRLLVYVGHKLFDDDRGLVPKWVEGEMRWRNTLTERLENQQTLCNKHADTLIVLNGTLQEGNKCDEISADALQRLVELHEDRGSIGAAADIIGKTSQDIRAMKQAALTACKMCRSISCREFPHSAEEVGAHCAEIERIIGKQ